MTRGNGGGGIDRRGFLGAAAAGVAAGLAARAGADDGGGEGGHPPIVDTHVHLWDLDTFRLPWIQPGNRLDRDYGLADFREATEGLGVVKGVYMEVDVAPEQQLAEAEHVVGLIRKGGSPLVAAIVSGRPAADDFAAYLDKLRDKPEIKGLRQVLHGGSTPAGYCLTPEFVRGIRLLGERGLSYDLCMRPAELDDAGKLVDACPDTRFILDHCGNANVRAEDLSPWRDAIARLASKPNLACKVSGIVASAAGGPWTADDLAPIVNHVLAEFGPDRVVFGGDWPVCTLAATYRQWVEALRTIVRDRPEADNRKLFAENAARVYRLA